MRESGGHAPVLAVRAYPRGPEDGAAPWEDPPAHVAVEGHTSSLDDSAPAVGEAHELVLVCNLAFTDNRSDDGVEAGAVAAPGQYPDSHGSAISSLFEFQQFLPTLSADIPCT